MPGRALIDWDDAADVAARLARPGPTATQPELDGLVAGLRAAAERAVDPVLDITGMTPAAGRAPHAPLSEVLVVDRARWARAAADSMRAMTDGSLVVPGGRPVPLAVEVASSAEVGAALAFMSSKILGQFDPYTPRAPGRLLLVAPNVLQVEREMKVRPADFRLWVCLHEQTHALQFATAPWLVTHLRESMDALVTGMTQTSGGLREVPVRLAALVRAVYGAVRGREGSSLVDGLLTPDQRVALGEMTAVMALLEGHADVAMDAVGPSIVPTVRSIRRKFDKRRETPGTSDGVLRRLLGMDAKIAQYRDGAAFVRAVTDAVGTAGLNAVWSDVSALPSAREIAQPDLWVRRVHG